MSRFRIARTSANWRISSAASRLWRYMPRENAFIGVETKARLVRPLYWRKMRAVRFLAPVIGAALVVCTLWAQRPFRQYPAWEYFNFPLPSDWSQPGEWTFARLMYPTTEVRVDWQSEFKRGFDWREGNTNWTIDYPRSDRHLASAIRRLTRIQARPLAQPINPDDDD